MADQYWDGGGRGAVGSMATLVLDNGAYTAKIGYSHANVRSAPCRNCACALRAARPRPLRWWGRPRPLRQRRDWGGGEGWGRPPVAPGPQRAPGCPQPTRGAAGCEARHGSVPLSRSVIPNCQFRSKTARLKTFTANQLDEIKDPSGLFYILPFQKVTARGVRNALPCAAVCACWQP